MKKGVILASALILLAAMLAGCVTRGAHHRNAPLEISLSSIDIEEVYYRPSLHGSVAVDKQSGVMYWISEAGAATLMVDKKGKPRIWRKPS